jgi:hypothetical protein
MNRRAPSHPRSGQTLLFLAFSLVVIALAVLWQWDIHKILHVKAKTRNGGDAAALAGARWQASSLNLIGHLNVMQAVAIADGLARGEVTFPEAEVIADTQARVAFAGPLLGVAAAQLAAKKNGMYVNEGYTSDLRVHAERVRDEYSRLYEDDPFAPRAGYPTAWHEYAAMLEALAEEGVAAMVENVDLYSVYSDDDHMLLNPAFYDAIAGRNWCWFYHNAYDLLSRYGGFRSWPPLPEIVARPPVNAEFFSLKLSRAITLEMIPAGPGGAASLVQLLANLAGRSLPGELARVPARWFTYRASDWTDWLSQIPDNFPWEGEVRPEYNYFGADAAVRLEEYTTLHSDSIHDSPDTPAHARRTRPVMWSAAAKPFGSLEGDQRPNRYGLVLPAFRDVRLIPVDTSSAPAGAMRPGWITFIYDILPKYMEFGPGSFTSDERRNFFARQLITWEDPDFHRDGVNWLNENSALCNQPPGRGGGGGGGGTRRGH